MAEDALARAREIAARLSGNCAIDSDSNHRMVTVITYLLGGITGGSDLGKRKNRWEDDSGASGPGCKYNTMYSLLFRFFTSH